MVAYINSGAVKRTLFKSSNQIVTYLTQLRKSKYRNVALNLRQICVVLDVTALWCWCLVLQSKVQTCVGSNLSTSLKKQTKKKAVKAVN